MANEETPADSTTATAHTTPPKRPWEGERAHLEAQLKDLPIWNRNPDLCAAGLRILERWHSDFDPSTWRRIEKRAAKELNEAEPCLRYASEWLLLAEGSKNDETLVKKTATIVDLCSGFGITSMFLSEILPADRVSRIWLLDKMWPCSGDAGPPKVNVNHIIGRHWPIPLHLRKTDIKAGREMRQVRKYVVEPSKGPVLVLGIHLCKALSIHAVKLFQSSNKITSMVLKPCCLPGKGMMFRRDPIIWKFANGYEFRPRDVYYEDEWRSIEKGKGAKPKTGAKGDNLENGNEVTDQASDGPDKQACKEEEAKNEMDSTRLSGGHDLKNHTNERFSRWVGHLKRACEDDCCKVCVKHIDITKHHFQNQFIFCEQITTIVG